MSTDRDVVLLLEACTARLGDEVLAFVRSEVGGDIRYRDGFVFQHLVEGALSVTELARRLGVSQQAASKQVADLEHRGLVRRDRDPGDGRARLVSLSDRGERVVQAGRDARLAVAKRLRSQLGSAFDDLIACLQEVSVATGAMEHLLDHKIKPHDGR